MKVARRQAKQDIGIDERRSWLHFSDGSIIDGRRCPRGILAKTHWVQVDDENIAAGEPNTKCTCPPSAFDAPTNKCFIGV